MIAKSDWLGDVTASHTPNPGGRPAKGYGGRQRKLKCDSCGFIAYATAGAVDRAGARPSCGCGGSMHWANERDRIIIEPRELLDDIGDQRFRLLCRELGFADLARSLVPTDQDRRSGIGSARCQWAGGLLQRDSQRPVLRRARAVREPGMSDHEKPQSGPVRRFAQQLDIDGRPHDIASEVERLRLFEPAPEQLPGQASLKVDNDA